MSNKNVTIAVLNLMPTKTETAQQLQRLFQQQTDMIVDLLLLYPESHYRSKKVPEELVRNYLPFSQIKEQAIDGFIVTGAPLEHLAFEEVDYWQELSEILDYLKKQRIPSLSICWGAQAALYHYYQIDKELLTEKKVGVFEHQVQLADHPLVAGEGPTFKAPHSRYTTVDEQVVTNEPSLVIVAQSEAAGLYLLASTDQLETYVFGHPEYATETLDREYQRDRAASSGAVRPENYYATEQGGMTALNTWQDHANRLYTNWLQLVGQTEDLPQAK